MSKRSLVWLRLRFDQSKTQLVKYTSLVWTKQPGCRRCCVHVRAVPSCIFGDNTRLSRPYTRLHNTGFISYCVQCGEKKVQTSSADISLEMGNISWSRVQGVMGNVQEVIMLRSVCRWEHTLTHSWKPDCSSSAEAHAYYSNHVQINPLHMEPM